MDKLLIALRRWGRRPYGPVVSVGGMMLVYGICNFGVPSIMLTMNGYPPSRLVPVLGGAIYGLAAGEIACLGIWVVLGSGPGLARIFLGALATQVLFYCAALPFSHDGALSNGDILKFGFVALPPLVILGAGPLWMLRAGWRWRISWAQSVRQARNSLSIAGLMTAMALVAIALAWIQAGQREGVLDPIVMLVLTILAALVLVLVALPAVLLILWTRRFFLGWLIANMVALVFTLILAIAYVLVFEFTRSPVSDETIVELLWVSCGFALAYVLVGNTPLLLARLMGARLTRG